jgi:hypothetical protein
MNREVRLAGSLCAFAVETETVGNDRNRRQIIRNGKRRRISADTSSLFYSFGQKTILYISIFFCVRPVTGRDSERNFIPAVK